MNITRLFFFLGLSSIFLIGCTSPKASSEAEWLTMNCSEIEIGDQFDFSSFKNALQDVRIVAIGESSHGIGEFYNLKSELVQYLHKEMDFNVIAFEAGVGDVNLGWQDRGKYDGSQLRDSVLFGNFKAQELTPLFDYLKSHSQGESPLQLAGFDSQTSTNYLYNKLIALSERNDPTLATSLRDHESLYYKWYQSGMQGDSVNYIETRDEFSRIARATEEFVRQNQSNFQLKEMEYKILIRALQSFQEAVDIEYADRYQGIALRDKVMFDNVEWLLNEVYPDQKIILWAHNGHIENTPVINGPYKWLGHYMNEKYKDDYYSLGFFARKGETFQHWTQQVVEFDNSDTTFIESKLTLGNQIIPFLNLSNLKSSDWNQWLFKPVKSLEMENGGEVSFIPVKRFDGVLCIREAHAPTFD